jgi:predicted transcriptional regulator
MPISLPRFTLRGFKPPRETMQRALGKLERQVLELAWERHEISVRDAHKHLSERVAYTTLMTTLDRLHKKGLLGRRKDGRAFFYSPCVSPQQFAQGIAQDLVESILGHDGEGVEPLLACIVDAVGERDRALLDQLDRLVQEKRRQLPEDK